MHHKELTTTLNVTVANLTCLRYSSFSNLGEYNLRMTERLFRSELAIQLTFMNSAGPKVQTDGSFVEMFTRPKVFLKNIILVLA